MKTLGVEALLVTPLSVPVEVALLPSGNPTTDLIGGLVSGTLGEGVARCISEC